MMRKIERENTGLLKPGQDLVVAGYAGLAGSAILANDQRARLSEWFSTEWLDQAGEMENSLQQDKIDWSEVGATDWESAGEGGLPRIWVSEPAAKGSGRAFVASYPCGADHGGWRALELAEVCFSEALGLPGEEHRRRRVDCYRAAEILLLHAAARGSVGAHCRLGVIYEGDLCEGEYWNGLADRRALHKADTPCDERAYLHFSFGTYHGHGECCWRLGDLVAAGRGCDVSATRAFSLYRRAFDLEGGRIDEDRASTGNAALRLARAFELGRGCEQDFRRARTWYRLAAISLGAAFDAGQWHFKRERIEARRGVARMAQEIAGTY